MKQANDNSKPIKISKNEIAPIDSMQQEFTHFKGFLLTKRGSLIGGIRLSGLDPDGLLNDDFIGLSIIARSFYEHIDSNITVTQYHAHYDGVEVKLSEREGEVSSLLSNRREAFLNQESLSSSDLVHFFEIQPSEAMNQLSSFELFKHLVRFPFNETSRKVVDRHYSKIESITCQFEELENQVSILSEYIDDILARWESVFNPVKLSLDDIWAFSKFLSNLDPYYLSQNYNGKAPDTSWDISLPDGDKRINKIKNIEVVKIEGNLPVYARVLSVNNFNSKILKAGLFSESSLGPSRQKGNFLLMLRFTPLSKIQKDSLFRKTESDLNRRNYNLKGMLSSNNEGLSEVDRRKLMKPAIREALEDLGEAEKIDDLWGTVQASIIVWDSNVKNLRNQSISIKRSLDRVNVNASWEGVGLPRAFKTFQLAGKSSCLRNIPFTATQFSSASLLYSSSLGQKVVDDLGGEEAQYIFISDDGSPFYYSPYVNERCVVIGVGPIRTGKSFSKNTLASHFMKYGGYLTGIDIDQGLEPVALAFGEDGGVFKTEDDTELGFNPFVSLVDGVKDSLFIEHLRSLIIAMISMNDNEEMRKVSENEQGSLDSSIVTVIGMPKEHHRLSTVVSHCLPSLQKKMARWIFKYERSSSSETGYALSNDSGIYAKYFDAEVDSIGSLTKKVMANNLRSIKDNKNVLSLVMMEIFFRTTRTFQNPAISDKPKYLDIDEAHVMLGMPYSAEYIERYIRTSGKYLGGIGLWSQSPDEFESVSGWSAIRSAASTFFFMADPNMDEDLYKRVFHITDGECAAIKSLKPKREAFIIQRGIGVSKKVILKVESEQYVISTSTGRETKIRSSNFEKFGFELGLDKTMKEFGLSPTNQNINY